MNADNLHAVPLGPEAAASGSRTSATVRVVHLPTFKQFSLQLDGLKGKAGAYESVIEQIGWTGARVRMRRGMAMIEAPTPPPAQRVRVGDEEADIVDLEELEKQQREEQKKERVRSLEQQIEGLSAAHSPKRLPDNNAPRGPTYSKAEFVAEFGRKEAEREWRMALRAHTEGRKKQLARLRALLGELQPKAETTGDADMQDREETTRAGDETRNAWQAWAQQQQQQRVTWEKARAEARASWEAMYEKRLQNWAEAQVCIATQREEAALVRQMEWMAEVERKLAVFETEMCARVESLLPSVTADAGRAPTPPAADARAPAQPSPNKKGKKAEAKAKKEAAEKEFAEQLKQLNQATNRAEAEPKSSGTEQESSGVEPNAHGAETKANDVEPKAKAAKGAKQQTLKGMLKGNRYNPLES
ncbi:hypothetical protein DIPPA_01414 [Diplonema papillatum]|nr:hypothetical protein DIPPA_01414 [Diplonema papillatum]